MRLLAILLVITLCGCMSGVVSETPVGDAITRPLLRDYWDQSWVAGDGSSFKTRVIDADAHIVEVYDISLLDSSGISAKLPFNKVTVLLRKLDDDDLFLIANARDPRFSDRKHFLFGMVVNKWTSLLIYAPMDGLFSVLGTSGSIRSVPLDDSTDYKVKNYVPPGYSRDPRLLIGGFSVQSDSGRKNNTGCRYGYIRLFPSGDCESARALFSPSPDYVFIRSNKAPVD